jgi:hypothetical protein
MNKPDVSAGRRDITVWAESAGRRLCKNRILYFKNIIFFSIFRKMILFSELKNIYFNKNTIFRKNKIFLK